MQKARSSSILTQTWDIYCYILDLYFDVKCLWKALESMKHKSETKGHELSLQCWKTLGLRHKDLLRVGRMMNEARIKTEKCTWIWRLDLGGKWACPLVFLLERDGTVGS